MVVFGRSQAKRIEALPDRPRRKPIKIKGTIFGQRVRIKF